MAMCQCARFWLETDRDFCQQGPQDQRLLVRAVQGHSMAQVDTDQVLERLEPPTMPQVLSTAPTGTTTSPSTSRDCWLGPKRSRTHIHLTQ